MTKKKITFTILVVAAVVAALLIVPAVIHARIERELQGFFKDAQVSVGRLSIEKPFAIAVSDIDIRAKRYQIFIQTTSLDRRLSAVQTRGLVVKLKWPNLSGEIRGSMTYDWIKDRVLAAHLESPVIKSGKLKAELLVLDLPAGSDEAVIRATLLKGGMSGRARLGGEGRLSYEAEFEFTDLDLDTLTTELKLQNKMTADGKLAGKISIRGGLSGIHSIEGRFVPGVTGGSLVIRDPNFLNTLAQNTRQPIALVEAAFKEYHFDSGSVSMKQSGRDLGLAVSLEGAKGKRDFQINLHDLL